MGADLNAKLNTNFCGTWHWWERGSATLQVSHTWGEAFGKAAISSLLKTELKPNQSATHTGPREILNWWSQTGQTQKEQVSGGGMTLPDLCGVLS